jgi:archaellum component FlaC
MLIDRARIAYSSRRTLIGFLEVFRNILVLFPIVLTWYALSEATKAYSTVGSTDLNIPFLYQWEQGFNGQIPSFLGFSLTFSHVAILDALIIGLIILFTAIVYWGSYKAEHNAIQLGADLDGILWQINKAINDDRLRVKGDAEQRSQQILESINNFIHEYQKQGQSLNQILDSEIGRLDTITQNYKEETSNLKMLSMELRESTNQLEILKIEIEGMSANQDQIEESYLSIEGQLGTFDAIVTELGRNLEKIASHLEKNANKYSDRLDEFSTLSKQLQTNLQEMNNLLNKNTANSASQLNSLVDKFSTVLDRTNEQLTNLTKEVSQLRKSFSNITTGQSPIQQKTIVDKIKDIFKG